MSNTRIKLFVFSDLIQATLLKRVSENDLDCIRITVYGYTHTEANIEFSYDVEFDDDKQRDQQFEAITQDEIFNDIKKIIVASHIPLQY